MGTSVSPCPTGVTDCIDADVKKAALVTKFGVTLDSSRASVKFSNMGADSDSATVQSLAFLNNLIDVAAECRSYGRAVRVHPTLTVLVPACKAQI
jgi:hypothetical protein